MTCNNETISHPQGRLGVDMSYITPYDFEDNNVMRAGSDVYDPKVAYLGRHCIAVGDAFLVKDTKTGKWTPMNRTNARNTLYAQRAGGRTELGLTHADIDDFVKKHAPVFSAPIFAPGAPEFVVYEETKRVNTWRDSRRPGDFNAVEEAEIILRLIRENLCNATDPASLPDMLMEVETKQTAFAYAMHFVASAYVNIGHHIGTALWFVGPNQGVGKGTLLTVMRHLIGAGQVVGVNVKEMEAWNSFLREAVLVEGDEVDFGTRKELAATMKAMIGNRAITIRERNVGSYTIPNVLNWIMTTNELAPIHLDPEDRRHTLIQTTSDRSRNELARTFNTLPQEQRLRAISGFAAILQSVEIDTAWIAKPFATALKTALIEESRDSVERWFETTTRTGFRWRLNEFQPTDTLFTSYLEWKSDNDPQSRISSKNGFARQLRNLEAQGFVRQSPDTSKRGWIKLRHAGTPQEHTAEFESCQLAA